MSMSEIAKSSWLCAYNQDYSDHSFITALRVSQYNPVTKGTL